jgi:ribosomal protein S12 methylthiotransferase
VDSEHLLKQIDDGRFRIISDGNTSADIVIINTCGFILDAKNESIDTILSYVALKERGEIEKLFVMGCLSQRYRSELKKEIPEVDAFFGVNQLKDIVHDLGAIYDKTKENQRYLITPGHYAYLKISEGCDRNCSFCAIPMIRGKHLSVPMNKLEEEAVSLAGQGVKELILIAQDLTYYGLDLYKKQCLVELLQRLCIIDGIEWIRLHYAYPAAFPLELIEIMKRESKICPYLDIPIQHSSNHMLKLMRRGYNRQQLVNLLNSIRHEIPDIALRTSILVGHPAETEDDFKNLMQFIEDTRFDKLGVFTYSHEENTHSYSHFNDTLSDSVKQGRKEAVMALQQRISLHINKQKTGKCLPVIIDRQEDKYYIGRTKYDSPEVDGEVLVRTGNRLKPGYIVEVNLTGANEYDLFGTV